MGWTYPLAPTYCVSRTKVVEFAHAIQDENPAYFDNHPIVPPTFAVVIAAQTRDSLFGDEELGLTLHHIAHADQILGSHRPLREGDDVVVRFIIERVRNRGDLGMVTILVALIVDGEAICDARSILVHTHEETPHD